MTTQKNAVREYRPSALLRIAGAGFFLVLGTMILIVGGSYSLSPKFDLKGIVVSVAMGGGLIFTALQAARMRVVLGRDDVCVRGAIRETCVPYSHIAGVDVERQGASQRIRLRNAQGRVLANISNWIDGYQAILASLNKRLEERDS